MDGLEGDPLVPRQTQEWSQYVSVEDVKAVLLGCLVPLVLREVGARFVQKRLEVLARRRPPWFVTLQAGLALVTSTGRFHEKLLAGAPQRVDAALGLVSKYRRHPVYMAELHQTRAMAGWSFMLLLTFIFLVASPALYFPSPDVTTYAKKTVIFACIGFLQSLLTQIQDDFSIWLASWPDFLRASIAVEAFSHSNAPGNAGVFFTIAMCRQLYMALYFESFSAFFLYSLGFLAIPMLRSEWFWHREVGFPLSMLAISIGLVLPAMQERVLRLEAKVEEYERERIFQENIDELERVQIEHEADIKRRHASYIEALQNKHKESTQKLHMVLSYTAHEYRNHFFQARGALEDLQCVAEGAVTSDELVASIMDAAKTLGRAHSMIQSLFDDVLQMHRLETAGEVDWRGSARPFCVGVDLFERARDYGKESVRRNIDLDFEASAHGSLNVEIMGNPEKFMQVVTNIISNAVKFTTSGAIRLHVSCSPVPDSSSDMELVFSVSDTGCGMTEDKLGKLFQPFAQARSADEFGYGGSGLGLYFARNIMRAYPHGALEVRSQRGHGTTFTGRARLPLNPNATTCLSPETAENTEKSMEPVLKAASQFDAKVKHPPASKHPDWKEANVLIVDDSPVNRALLRRMLTRRCGPRTAFYEAPNGQEAVKLASTKGKNISVILMDRHMPIMDGIEATKRIREFDKSSLIIAVTGNADDETQSSFLSAGCDCVWHKGSTIESLFALVHQARKNKSSRIQVIKEIPVADSLDNAEQRTVGLSNESPTTSESQSLSDQEACARGEDR
ncbi:Hybrid signal transduction histidine kinase K [Hondaea fermentalgiana]|uniref:histidine kinase n=1 Tax=Hondaea fermentalgiana TaxID=2315210 RepID=A0A2R5GI66_9STRA|nr:Hybrid signal transduction histidine kinase K [Hondaea fermentalgiana]|eukprot:GBG27981.1 Hybrid signal transduction histidine kinase K [Hondaea fermentalgiana]